MSDRDLYEESYQLAVRLAERGHDDAARCIRDAIDGGSTASEILVDLRSAFDRLLQEQLHSDTELYAWTADLHSAVDALLE